MSVMGIVWSAGAVTTAGTDITTTVISGPYLLAAGLALAAGVVSFASPCVLPLVPGYLSYLAGLVGADETAAQRQVTGAPVAGPAAVGPADRRPEAGSDGSGGSTATVRTRAVTATVLFVAGFTAVFLAESLLVLGVASVLLEYADLLTRIGGVVMIVMGLAMLGWIRPLQREARIHARPSGRVWGAVLLGAFFAIGWTVCLGPTFIGVNALVVSTDWNGNAWRGLTLVVLYCLGLGLPFVALAFGFGWATSAVGVLRRHSRTIQVVGGGLLIVIGLLMVSGLWGSFIAWLQGRYAGVGTLL